MRRLALPIAFLFAAGLPAGQIQFEDVAGKAGVDFTLRNAAAGRFHQIELMVAGVAAFDFDNDGCQDIYFVNGAAIPSLEKEGRKAPSFTTVCSGTIAISPSPM